MTGWPWPDAALRLFPRGPQRLFPGIGGSGGGGGSPPVNNLVYRGSDTAVSPTVHTTAAISIGTASADRNVIVCITGKRTSANPARTISSVTIGGIAATIDVQIDNGTNACTAGIAHVVVPTGTTAVVVVTWSGALLGSDVSVYTVTGLNSNTPVYTGSNAVTSGDPTVNATVNANGYAFGAFTGASPTLGTTSWTGLTKDQDVTFGSSTARSSHASSGGLSAQTLTITPSCTTGNEVLAAATWA